jgi:cell shape-determining protein MreC
MIRRHHYQVSRNKLIGKVASFVFVFLAIYFLGGFLLRPVAGPLSYIFRPLWWGSEALFTSGQSVFDFFRDKNSLAIDNRLLQEENNKLKIKLLAMSQEESDNNYLRSLLGRIEDSETPIVGEVIFLPNFVPNQTLLLDVGEENLSKVLRVGDIAVADDSVLIGRVAEVGPWFSKVRLSSAEDSLSVVIGSNNIPALALGSGAGNFSISLPKDTEVFVGDKVVTPLYNNLLVGTVRHIDKNPSQPNQSILVKTPVNLWQLRWLEIYHAKI